MKIYLAGGFTVTNVKGRERVESADGSLEEIVLLLLFKWYNKFRNIKHKNR